MMDSPIITVNNSFAVDPHTDNCQTHGKVTNISFNYDGKEIGRYCFLCYHEFIKANVTAVTPT